MQRKLKNVDRGLIGYTLTKPTELAGYGLAIYSEWFKSKRLIQQVELVSSPQLNAKIGSVPLCGPTFLQLGGENNEQSSIPSSTTKWAIACVCVGGGVHVTTHTLAIDLISPSKEKPVYRMIGAPFFWLRCQFPPREWRMGRRAFQLRSKARYKLLLLLLLLGRGIMR